jgi:hypothetical protein
VKRLERTEQDSRQDWLSGWVKLAPLRVQVRQQVRP